ITLAILANPGSGTLAGTVTVNAVNGVATFAGLSINNAANGYTLRATAGGLTPITSSAFNVAIGTATQLVFSTNPSSSRHGVVFAAQPVLTLKDAGGNVVTGSSAS